MPQDMQAIEIVAPGKLVATHRPLPMPLADEVLIRVEAAGVNRPDIMQRQGLYPPPPGASDIPGLEVAGTIAALGDEVRHLQLGDRVCALVTGGGYAQYCTAAAELCLPLPKGMTAIQAAGLPETFFTVWSNLFDRAGLEPGETLLVHGGGSGIGVTAIQMAKAFGAHVFVTAGSAHKCAFCRELGADAAINYREQDFVEEVLALTGGKGVDVILDMIGGDYFPRNLKCMAFDARLVQIAVQGGPKAEINLLQVFLKRLTITGSTLRARDSAFKAAIAGKLREHVWPLLESGDIHPVIDTVLPLAEAAGAHALMESSRHIGKIILTV
ncbi:NAD(P)H-quinone oxidoreductase [Methylotuvimicrobium sp. KM2]|uniref:NAD(P)H-quinone oxidoreductase n=1 Tax=Methylotuvimicrobium sp. KM2 TaxID=3133976 RepID=UPI003100F98B